MDGLGREKTTNDTNQTNGCAEVEGPRIARRTRMKRGVRESGICVLRAICGSVPGPFPSFVPFVVVSPHCRGRAATGGLSGQRGNPLWSVEKPTRPSGDWPSGTFVPWRRACRGKGTPAPSPPEASGGGDKLPQNSRENFRNLRGGEVFQCGGMHGAFRPQKRHRTPASPWSPRSRVLRWSSCWW